MMHSLSKKPFSRGTLVQRTPLLSKEAEVLDGITFYLLLFFLVLGVPILFGSGLAWLIGDTSSRPRLKNGGKWVFVGFLGLGTLALFVSIVGTVLRVL